MASRHRRDQNNTSVNGSGLSLNGARHGEGNGAETNRENAESEDTPGSEPAGKIEVSPKAISHLAYRAAVRSYGVVGLASRHARPGWAELLRREEVSKGVEVTLTGNHVVINLYVIIEYGTRISEVAHNIMSNVKFALESSLDVSVVQVNVTVQGIRVSD